MLGSAGSRYAKPSERGSPATAQRSMNRTALAPRKSSIVRVPDTSDRIAASAAATLDGAKRKLHAAPKATMRFLQFVRVYIRGFAAGAGTFLLLSELASGHFNIAAALATHAFMIIAAPFYALMLAPAIFAIYSWTAILPVRQELRIYAMCGGIGALMIVPELMRVISSPVPNTGRLISGSIFLVSALVGAWTFNRAAAKRQEREA